MIEKSTIEVKFAQGEITTGNLDLFSNQKYNPSQDFSHPAWYAPELRKTNPNS
jgi:hypothetical protein